MRSIDDFLKKRCIAVMEPQYRDNWVWFANIIGEDLDGGGIYKNVAFTLHDFSNHCYRIYDYISDVILYKEVFEKNELSPEALYVLNMAVLFHDYSMALPINFEKRLIHPKLSKEAFENYCIDNKKTIKNRIAPRQIGIIGGVILAHGDLKAEKNGKIETIEITLTKEKPQEYEKGDIVDIPVKLLGGILRLADELDITQERLGGKEDQLEYLDESDKDQAESIRHWERLEYFDEVINERGSVLLKLNHKKFVGDTLKAEEIATSVRDKIVNEYARISECCFYNSYERFFNCKDFILKYPFELGGSEAYITGIQKQDDETAKQMQKSETEAESVSADIKNLRVVPIPGKICDKIDTLILESKLLIGSHYTLASDLCARDWINTNAIIEDKEERKEICKEFKEHIDMRLTTDQKNKTLIVGIEVLGAILASHIAFELKMPFSYIIPEKSGEHNSMQDKKFQIEKPEKKGIEQVILFTDVIATGDTIKEAIKQNSLSDKVHSIYTLLYRPIGNYESFKDRLSRDNDILTDIQIYSMNDRFPVILFSKNDCLMNSLAERCQKEFNCLDCKKIKM